MVKNEKMINGIIDDLKNKNLKKDDESNNNSSNDNLNDKNLPNVKKVCEDKLKTVQKKLQKKDTQRFKSKYFDYYDDIKISDRQDW